MALFAHISCNVIVATMNKFDSQADEIEWKIRVRDVLRRIPYFGLKFGTGVEVCQTSRPVTALLILKMT